MDFEIKCLQLIRSLKHDELDEASILEREILELLPTWEPERATKTATILSLKYLLLQQRYFYINQFFEWVWKQEDFGSNKRVKRLVYCNSFCLLP